MPLYYLETEKKTTLIFTVVVFTFSRKTYSHRCQCEQMHRNYFWITMALCHLTAVLSCHLPSSYCKIYRSWHLSNAVDSKVFSLLCHSVVPFQAAYTSFTWVFSVNHIFFATLSSYYLSDKLKLSCHNNFHLLCLCPSFV